MSFPWSLYLAEVRPEDELPNDLRPLHGRVLFRPQHLEAEELRRVVRIGSDPDIGPVYARPVATGTTLETLHAHPLFERARASKLAELSQAFITSQMDDVARLEAWFREFGLGELFDRTLEELRPARLLFLALEGTGVPLNVRGAKVFVTGAQPVEVKSVEEAEQIAALYRWGRTHRVSITSLGRDADDRPVFEVGAYLLPADAEAVSLPVLNRPERGNGRPRPARLVRQGKGKLAVELLSPLHTRNLRVYFLPRPR